MEVGGCDGGGGRYCAVSVGCVCVGGAARAEMSQQQR